MDRETSSRPVREDGDTLVVGETAGTGTVTEIIETIETFETEEKHEKHEKHPSTVPTMSESA